MRMRRIYKENCSTRGGRETVKVATRTTVEKQCYENGGKGQKIKKNIIKQQRLRNEEIKK